MKFFVLAFIFSGVFVCSTSNKVSERKHIPNIKEYGRREPFDQLVHLEVVTRPYAFSNINCEADFIFPPRPIENLFEITLIRVTDLWRNGVISYLENGGPHRTHAILHFSSMPFKGIRVLIEVFGNVLPPRPPQPQYVLIE